MEFPATLRSFSFVVVVVILCIPTLHDTSSSSLPNLGNLFLWHRQLLGLLEGFWKLCPGSANHESAPVKLLTDSKALPEFPPQEAY